MEGPPPNDGSSYQPGVQGRADPRPILHHSRCLRRHLWTPTTDVDAQQQYLVDACSSEGMRHIIIGRGSFACAGNLQSYKAHGARPYISELSCMVRGCPSTIFPPSNISRDFGTGYSRSITGCYPTASITGASRHTSNGASHSRMFVRPGSPSGSTEEAANRV